MREWEFTVILKGVDVMTPTMSDALFEAGCDDSHPGSSCGVAMVGFTREADSLDAAISSAVHDVRRAGCEVDHVVLNEDDLNALSAPAATA